MPKLSILFLALLLLCQCNFFKKPDNSNPEGFLADSISAGPRGKDNRMQHLDTITLNGKLFHLDSVSKAEFDALNESDPDTNCPADVRQMKDGITFKLKNGDMLVLKNIIEYDDYDTSVVLDNSTPYFYQANFTNADYWYVGVSFYEGGGNILVNKTNGKSRYFVGTPKLSPDRKYFVSGQYDMSGESGSGFDLCKIGTDSLEPVFTADPGWGPNRVKWKDNHTLYLEQFYWSNGNQQGLRYSKLNLEPLL